MERVYQQAEQVIANVPQTEEDQENLGELVGRIWDAKRKQDEEMAEKKGTVEKGEFNAEGEDKKAHIGLIPILDLDPVMVDVRSEQQDEVAGLKYEARVQEIQRQTPEKSQFLEDFGLPPVDSPLWGS